MSKKLVKGYFDRISWSKECSIEKSLGVGVGIALVGYVTETVCFKMLGYVSGCYKNRHAISNKWNDFAIEYLLQ